MSNAQVLLDLTKTTVEPVVTHHNEDVIIAFYEGENQVLQVTLTKEDCWNLPDMILKNIGCKDTEELGEECNKLSLIHI